LIAGEQEEQDLFFTGKVVEHRAHTEPGFLRDLAHAGAVIAAIKKEVSRGSGDTLLAFQQAFFISDLGSGFAFFPQNLAFHSP
jgi:hypothetical protein